MATLPHSECARFVDSSRRATKHLAWNAAGRSNQPKSRRAVHQPRTRFAHILTGWLKDGLVPARTESARHFQTPAQPFPRSPPTEILAGTPHKLALHRESRASSLSLTGIPRLEQRFANARSYGKQKGSTAQWLEIGSWFAHLWRRTRPGITPMGKPSLEYVPLMARAHLVKSYSGACRRQNFRPSRPVTSVCPSRTMSPLGSSIALPDRTDGRPGWSAGDGLQPTEVRSVGSVRRGSMARDRGMRTEAVWLASKPAYS
jgi:hypothetical protein